MHNVHHITSLDATGIQPYRTLRRPLEHQRRGLLVAEGEKVVRRLLSSPLQVRSLLLTPEWRERMTPLLEAGAAPGAEIFVTSRALLQEIVGFRFHQGIMALAEVPPEPMTDALPSPHLLVALDGLAHAENVGVVLRNAAALGADGIIVGETSASPFLRRAVRNSMGAVFRLPVFHPASLSRMLGELWEHHGTRIIAADASGSTPLAEAELGGNLCVVVGNEQEGIAPEILERCTARVRIPMDREIDSLNVASALAVLLYAIRTLRMNREAAAPR
jgi:tRNA G18 (ribose-2'-O)-methylase SpoU